MTPDEEAHFIQLWQEGASYREIAEALRCPQGTVSSRATRLVDQGKITPRPRGGAYPRRHALARQGGIGVSTDTPEVSTQVSSDTPSMQYLPPNQGELSPLLHDILQELRSLTGALAARVSTDTPPVSHDTPRVSTRTPLPAERGKSVRWNLHLSEGLRERIKALAKARGLQDSQMVEELLWVALTLNDQKAGESSSA